jgi:hypothetical protein
MASRSVEDKMLVHLPIVIMTSLHPITVADTVPKFDIARECRSEGSGSKPTQDRCLEEEKQALNQLRTEWAKFGPSAKSQCIQESGMGDTPSYVELLTCLEMESEVKKSQK